MKETILLTIALLTACLQIKAQTLATEYKGTASGNPISGSVFCADPTAIEYDGRLYVYGTNDHQQWYEDQRVLHLFRQWRRQRGRDEKHEVTPWSV